MLSSSSLCLAADDCNIIIIIMLLTVRKLADSEFIFSFFLFYYSFSTKLFTDHVEWEKSSGLVIVLLLAVNLLAAGCWVLVLCCLDKGAEAAPTDHTQGPSKAVEK